ncbi:hypothetical protein [Salinisphaera sp. LB1]|uniref:hypothetical protein n=1 Tax=Salinisphaera sp. LB1 TaxID=2183911 RepID=UPI000D7089D1|nr:hypothetical protein [Salinisphaera sp. LB1]AWN15335.1 hypothetical protein SALB1_1128 [Salinisphaera sp. LB1]
MTSVLVVVGVLIALRFLMVRRNRATRMKYLRENAARLTYDEARQRYHAYCHNLGSRPSDPLHRRRLRDAEADIEQAEFYYERMIELETGHAGPAVRLSIRPTLLGLYKAGAARRLPQP